jgi:stage II sporulation protein AB (anti-sigma F factor)
MPERTAGAGGAPANDMELRVPSLAANAEVCRLAVAVFASALPFTLAEIEQLKVAVSEAVGNCVLHAYPPDRPGRVALRAELQAGAVVIEVEDWGRGIADVRQARQPGFTTSDDPDHIGIGFEMMEQFTDALEVVSEPGRGTLVRMRKAPAGQAPGEAG